MMSESKAEFRKTDFAVKVTDCVKVIEEYTKKIGELGICECDSELILRAIPYLEDVEKTAESARRILEAMWHFRTREECYETGGITDEGWFI